MAKALAIGESRLTRKAHLSLQEVVRFAETFDPQPMHVDEAAAKDGYFGGLIASGWHVLALTMRLVVEARPLGDHPLIGTELATIRFRRPVPPDAEIMVRLTLQGVEPARALLYVETLDAASDDVLVTQNWKLLLTQR